MIRTSRDRGYQFRDSVGRKCWSDIASESRQPDRSIRLSLFWGPSRTLKTVAAAA